MMFSQFKLPNQHVDYQAYTDADEYTMISPLSQINFFIGPNNSGKSRLLRQLLKDLILLNPVAAPDKLSNKISGTQLAVFSISILDIKQKLQIGLSYIDACIKNNVNKQLIFSFFEREESDTLDELELADYYLDLRSALNAIYQGEFDKLLVQTDSTEKKRQDYVKNLFGQLLSEISKLLPIYPKCHFTYVPAFRTLRRFLREVPKPSDSEKSFSFDEARFYDPIEEQIFKTRVAFDYFRETPQLITDILYAKARSVESFPNPIFTGESLYDEIQQLRNSGEKVRKILINFQGFLSSSFFEHQLVELNALDIDGIKDVYIKIGDEKEFPIFHLGDGIQAIILLTFPLFINQDKDHQIFYEEPELYLHPGMQRIFINALNKFNKTQAYIATHSNHFLDASLDYPKKISIFSLTKNLKNEGLAKFYIENLSSPKMSVLNALGVRNSSVLLANCSIWVEGITDRLYLKQYLEIFMRDNPDNNPILSRFNEDMHYVFFEYGGDNVLHYSFSEEPSSDGINARFLSNKVFLIHDKDQGKKTRHDRLRQELNEHYYMLDVLEIENLLSPHVLKRCLEDFRNDDNCDLEIPLINREDYQLVPLGIVVKKYIPLGLKKIFSLTGKSKIPRLYNKVNFAQNAINYINKWEDLSLEAQCLTRKLYSFILNNNSMNNGI